MLQSPLLRAPGFTDNTAEEFDDGAFVERPRVGPAGALDHLALARPVLYRQPRAPLRFAHANGQGRPRVKEAKQLAVNRVYLGPPVFYGHLNQLAPLGGWPGEPRSSDAAHARQSCRRKRPASTSFSGASGRPG